MVKRDKLFGLLKENAAMAENLKNTQNRCSQLLEEARTGKRLLKVLIRMVEDLEEVEPSAEETRILDEARTWAATPL